MQRCLSILVGVCLFFSVAVDLLRGGIPQPDAIFYGTITINGQPVVGNDNLNVIAKEADTQRVVGQYLMGDNPAAGDQYVLRVKLETVVSGSPLSSDALTPGVLVDLYVNPGPSGGEELVAEDLSTTQPGALTDLPVVIGTAAPQFLSGDCNVDGSVDIGDIIMSINVILSEPSAIMATCRDACDSNNDGSIDVADIICLINVITGQSGPPCPSSVPVLPADCSPDASPALGCATYDMCP